MTEEWKPVVGYEGLYEVSNTAALMQALPQRFGTLAAYNDQPDRTQAEVVGLFNQAINGVKAVVV